MRAWLPPAFGSAAAAMRGRVPVLLLLDGQNVFYDEESYSGSSWRAAEAASALIAAGAAPPFAVAAIDNAGARCATRAAQARACARPCRHDVECALAHTRTYRRSLMPSFRLPSSPIPLPALLPPPALLRRRPYEYLPYRPGMGPGDMRPEAADWPGGGISEHLGFVLDHVAPALAEAFPGLGANEPALRAFGGSSFGGVAALHMAMERCVGERPSERSCKLVYVDVFGELPCARGASARAPVCTRVSWMRSARAGVAPPHTAHRWRRSS